MPENIFFAVLLGAISVACVLMLIWLAVTIWLSIDESLDERRQRIRRRERGY